MKGRRVFLLVLLLTFIASLAFSTGQSESAEGESSLPRFIEIGTAGTGGAYYPIGIAMAEILTDKLGIQATAQVTGGAVDNIRLIQEESVKLAITSTASAYKGLVGQPPFSEKHDKVRGLFSNLTLGVFQVAVMADSDIIDFPDLKGKRISLGPQGGLGVEISQYAFNAAGFSFDDVKATFLSYAESATTMADGNLDAIIIQSAIPSPALRQLIETGKEFRMLSVPDDVIAEVHQNYPYYSSYTLSSSVYGTPTDIKTLKSTNMVVVDIDMPDEVVYKILEALFSDIEKIKSSHPAAKVFAAEMASEMPIPLHPGAERYYKEHNLLEN